MTAPAAYPLVSVYTEMTDHTVKANYSQPAASFASLVGPGRWAQLHPSIQRRFGAHRVAGQCAIYAGAEVETRLSLAGRLLAFALVPLGAPLPLTPGRGGVAAIVAVTPGGGTGGGEHWSRLYANRRHAPQVIRSRKRFCGPTGLEERLCGFLGSLVCLPLELECEPEALHFVCRRYQIALGPLRITLPRWLSPGEMRVTHLVKDDTSFEFRMTLIHPVLGELIAQTCAFTDTHEARR